MDPEINAAAHTLVNLNNPDMNAANTLLQLHNQAPTTPGNPINTEHMRTRPRTLSREPTTPKRLNYVESPDKGGKRKKSKRKKSKRRR